MAISGMFEIIRLFSDLHATDFVHNVILSADHHKLNDV